MNVLLENYQPKWSNQLKWFIGISFLLHILFLLFYGFTTNYQFFQTVTQQEEPGKKIVPEKKIVFEVIESPDQEEDTKAPENAELFSDKNTRAKNPDKTDQLGDTPFSVGEQTDPIMPEQTSQKQETGPAKQQPEEPSPQKTDPETSEEFSYVTSPNTTFSRDVLLGKKSKSSSALPQPKYDNRKFSAEDLGGFAFNTYNWNWAPFALYLKKNIERHIFPPPAFSKMGIIDGRSVIRFFISKDGKLLDLKVLNYEGHKSLMETSVNGIIGSSPFRPLPRDFPEDLLEVTYTFTYKIYRYKQP